MSTSWFNIFYLILVWGFAIYSKVSQVGFDPLTIFLVAFFFIIYFSLRLIKKHKLLYQISIFLLNLITFLNLWTHSFNGFIFLILIIIAIEILKNFKGFSLFFHLFIQYIIVISPLIISQDLNNFVYMNLSILLASFLIVTWNRTSKSYIILENTHDKLQSDYRKLKRQSVIQEKNVRQEERNQIAREIHDSVGHRLTALLIQLEVLRLQTKEGEELEKIKNLKSLAQLSLNETREAVKALKSEETTGLTSVIQLIRKLESESHLQVAFNIGPGALSFPLSSQQSIVLYRSVQEGLTNMMRHSGSREAKVNFSVIGGNFFRFQISNPLKDKVEFVEGFGLTAMRERIEEIDGTLNISLFKGKFIITGTFPMEKED